MNIFIISPSLIINIPIYLENDWWSARRTWKADRRIQTVGQQSILYVAETTKHISTVHFRVCSVFGEKRRRKCYYYFFFTDGKNKIPFTVEQLKCVLYVPNIKLRTIASKEVKMVIK